MDCLTPGDLAAIETRQRPIWILGEQGYANLGDEFGVWPPRKLC